MADNIFLGLGSNLGDRLGYLEAALAALPPSVRILRRSSIFETAPWGYTEQEDFLNMVVEVETELSPQELLTHIKAIEQQVGRKGTFRHGPREIDVDILLYGDLQIVEAGLAIPHPGLQARAFMMTPLAELAPGLRHPGWHQTVKETLLALDASGVKPYQVHETPHHQ